MTGTNETRISFLAEKMEDIKFHKLMFLKKGGKVEHKLGDISRDIYDAELICVSNEEGNYWIGNFAEGLGFFGVRFSKDDCREATEEEVNIWLENHESIKY